MRPSFKWLYTIHTERNLSGTGLNIGQHQSTCTGKPEFIAQQSMKMQQSQNNNKIQNGSVDNTVVKVMLGTPPRA